VAGQRVLLSISAELQEYAEALLAQNETFREVKDADGKPSAERPWIKGGSIVALDPRSGEVLALASYPRLDPNDFISVCNPEIKKKRQASVLRWLENEAYIGELWDGKRPLERELFSFADNAFYEEALPMDWKRYLATILPPKSALYQTMLRIQDVRTAVRIQQEIETLLELSGQENLQALITSLYPAEEGYTPFRQPVGTDLKKEIRTQLSAQAQAVLSAKTYLDVFLRPISYNNDQLLVIDLCRLLVNKEGISEELLQEVGKESIASFRSRCQAAAAVKSSLRKLAQEWFHEIDFQTWRDAHFKEFLKKKRLEEKEKKQYARPYTEYLELLEKNMFKEFWQSHCHAFLQVFLIPGTASFEKPYLERLLRVHAVELEASANTLRAHLATLPSEIVPSYLRMLRSFEDLNRPLLGRYRSLRHTGGVQQEKHLAASFYPLAGFGYGRSQAFRQSSPQGSVFKVVTSYAALLERYRWLIDNQRSLSEMNPLTLIDDLQWNKPGTNQQILGYTLDGTPITRLYKGGRLPRSSHPHIGKIDLLGALEQSSNLYFAMLSSDHIQEPNALAHIAHLFGFGERSGIDLPGETAGEVPDDLGHNRTGLYAFAMGQHSLVVTPLQSALMLAAIANHGKVLKPKIVQLIAGKAPARKTQNLFCRTEFPLQDDLALIGISFPLFTSTLKDTGESTVSQSPTEVRRILLLPDELRDQLLEGMHRVVCGTRGTARAHIIRSLYENAQVMRDYLDLQNQIVGKTGTAEILYKQTIDAESQAEIVNHIWFACISFASPIDQSKERSSWPDPELIVVVLLRFGKAGGREAAPLATQMIKKWREICAKHGRSAHIVPLPESSGLFSSGPH
jgi:cell division protein FtsI/penicillin-binding protein 2